MLLLSVFQVLLAAAILVTVGLCLGWSLRELWRDWKGN